MGESSFQSEVRTVDRGGEELVRRLRRGSEEALGEIIQQYTAYVGAVIWHIVEGKLSENDAAELVSDSFYTLWRNRDKARPEALKGYLGSIARSKALNALRRHGLDEPLEEDALTLSLPGPEDETIRREEYKALQRALDSLGEPDRSIFIRHYYYCRSARRIGEELGLNLNTVHTKLRRGRERLKAELEKGGYYHE